MSESGLAVRDGADLRSGQSLRDWIETWLYICEEDPPCRHLPLIARPSQVFLDREMDRAIEVCRERHVPVRASLIKPRRAGWTTWILGRLVARCETEPRIKCRYLAKTGKDQPKQFAKARYMHDHLDPRWRAALANPDALSEMRFVSGPDGGALGSLLDSDSASSPRSGRGLGYVEQLLDEIAHVDSNRSEQDLLWASIDDSSRLGAVWKLSTPNGVNNLFHDHVQEAIAGKRDEVVVFMPHPFDDECQTRGLDRDTIQSVLATLTSEEIGVFERFHRTYGETHGIRIVGDELARRIHWRRTQIRSKGKLFFQEFPEDLRTCWLSPGTSFFGAEALAHQDSIARPPIRSELNGALLVYVEPVPDHDYIVATDTSMGLEGSDPAMSAVLDFDTGEFVAVLAGQIPPQLMAEVTARHLLRPYCEALWAPEISPEHSGHAALAHMRQVVGYGRIYRHRPQGRINPETRREFGFPTTSQTRPVILEDLRAVLEESVGKSPELSPIRINDRRILANLQSFKLRDITGDRARYEAERGAHDEGAIVAAIAQYVRAHGRIRPQCH